VYATGDTRERQFRWYSRSGAAQDTVGPPGLYVTFDLASDTSAVVAEVSKDITARRSTLLLFETARAVSSPLTVGDQNDSDPRFQNDGSILFARNASETPGIVRLDLKSNAQSVTFARGALPVIWLEDAAKTGDVVYRSGANRDAWQLVGGRGEPRRLTNAREPIEQVEMSPDGRWIAYNTAESGRSEVFVSSVPAGSERRQISVEGGVQATWRQDGRELYYLGLDGAVYAVTLDPSGSSLRVGAPSRLFRSALPVISAVVEQYRPSGDGQRFLFCLPLTAVRSEPLRMILNWPSRLNAEDAAK
jgi:eukaryotic-like serine/threonine-protein kinase